MPSSGPDDITVLVVNFRTEALTRRCVETLRAHYPDLRLLLIDNGSGDASTSYVRALGDRDPAARTILNPRNLYHGPALDQGVRAAETRYVFTLDSDCETLSGGFLEQMLEPFADPRTYAVGELRYKNRYGHTYGYGYAGYGELEESRRRSRIPYVHPYAMLLDRAKYLTLEPFVHHGAPAIRNMRAARRAGLRAVDFPVAEFILHHERGTSAHHGYGARGRARLVIEGYLNRLEGYVTRDRTLR